MKPEEVLAELEDVIRSTPPRATIRHTTPENLSWLGRVVAVLGRWSARGQVAAPMYVQKLHAPMGMEGEQGYVGLMVLLHEAHADLRMSTFGSTNIAIGHGRVFEYFDEIRKIITLAESDLFFIDPYLDAEFVSRYLPQIRAGVSIRLLARERLETLVPAAKQFAEQSKKRVEVRSAPNFHERFVLVDGASCYLSGASFKDGARTAPATIT